LGWIKRPLYAGNQVNATTKSPPQVTFPGKKPKIVALRTAQAMGGIIAPVKYQGKAGAKSRDNDWFLNCPLQS
jgi:hypothetical protein